MDSCYDKLVICKQNSLYKWYCCCPNILSTVNMRGYELSITCWLQIKVNIFSSLIFLSRSFEAFKGKASFEAFLIILIMMKCEAICRALLNLSWKVLEAPSLWVTEIVNYRKNYTFPFGKKKRNFVRYFSYIISKSQVHHGSTCHSAPFWCTHPPWTARRTFSMENICNIVCKNLFFGREFNPIPEVCDWYICCACVLLISFSNQVTDKLKTPFYYQNCS